MMKILWVKAGGLVPPDTGGKIRSYNILRELARDHAVTLFTFYGKHANDIHQTLESVLHRVICIPLDFPARRGPGELGAYVANLLSSQPYNVEKYCRREVRTRLLETLLRNDYDVILCDFLTPAGAIPWDWPIPKVIFTHNVEAQIWQRHYGVARNPLWKALSWYEWRRMRAAEIRYLKLADCVLAVSESDCGIFSAFLDTIPRLIPTGVDVRYFQPSPEPEESNSLVFTGSMDWLPNEDAILYFVKEILPLVRKEAPSTSLRVVGRHPSATLQSLAAQSENVQLTGWVEDVRPFLAKGAVCIVPLRIGGGTRLKIFEAMAMGKAVVSTSVGAEGLPVRHGEHILIADDRAGFAHAVTSLLRDPVRRRTIGLAARELVAQKYGWTAVAQDFAVALSEVVSKAKGGTAYSSGLPVSAQSLPSDPRARENC